MKKLKLQFLLLLAILTLPPFTKAQGNAFNYQGRLTDNGIAASGLYDFVFTVQDALVDGNALGEPLAIDAIPVTAGQFVVPLDFGPNVFTGAPRWLQIGVRANGPGAHTPLAPRQALSPAPYAIFAANAGSVAKGTVAADQLNTGGNAPAPGQYLSYDGGNLIWRDPSLATGIFALNGTAAYFNAGSVGLGTDSPDPGIRLHVNGNTRLAPGGSGGYVQVGTPNGETGLGVIGDNRFDLRFDGSTLKLVAGMGLGPPPAQYGVTINTAGNVGIGMASPLVPSQWKLEINGPTRLTPGGSGGSVQFSAPNGETGMGIIGANRADVRFDGSTLKLVAGAGVGAPASENGIAITTAGNVGVGTTTPLTKLHAVTSEPGKTAIYGVVNSTSSVGVYGSANAPSSVGVWGHNTAGLAVYADGNAGQARDKGGFVKAMAYINPFLPADQYVVRCYNSTQAGNAASTSPCGITVTRFGEGGYSIDFGFKLDDRFFSVTPTESLVSANCIVNPSNDRSVLVYTFYVGDTGGAGATDSRFNIIVF